MAPAVSQSVAAELELADRARDGDRAAMVELYQRYRRPLYRHAWRMLRNDAAALDVVQEAFTRAIAAIPRTREQLKFKAWIFRIATNLCLKQLNRSGRWASDGEQQLSTRRADDAAGDPERGRRHAEMAGMVAAALDQLPPRYRQILLLREVDELSYEELAQVLDLDRNRVKVTLHRARARFAALFIAGQLRADPTQPVACDGLGRLLRAGATRRQLVAHLESCPQCRQPEHRPLRDLFGVLPPVPLPHLPLPPLPATGLLATGQLGLVATAAVALVPATLATLVLSLSPSEQELRALASARRPRLAGTVAAKQPGPAPVPKPRAAHVAAPPASVTPERRPPVPEAAAPSAPAASRPAAASSQPVAPPPPAPGLPALRLKLRFVRPVWVQRGADRFALEASRLQLGDRLLCRPDAPVGLLLPAGQWIVCRGPLRLDRLPVRGASCRDTCPVKVTLLAGETRARATAKGGGILVQAGAGGSRCAGEGGEFRVNLARDRVKIEALDAYVTLRGAHASRLLPPGTRLVLDERPGFAHRLVPAPADLAPVMHRGPVPPRLSWRGVPTARRYRIQIAKDAHFVEVVHTTEGTAATLQPPHLPKGKYFWQVTALDEEGQLGLPSKIFSFVVE